MTTTEKVIEVDDLVTKEPFLHPKVRAPRRRTVPRRDADCARALIAIFVIVDFAACVAAAFIAYGLRYRFGILPIPYLPMAGLAGMLFTHFSFGLRAYSLDQVRKVARGPAKVIAAWSAAMIVIVCVIYFGRLADELSRFWIAFWYLTGLSILLIQRVLLYDLIARLQASNKFSSNVVVLGSPRATGRLVRRLSADEDKRFSVVGTVAAHWTGARKDDADAVAKSVLSLGRQFRVDEVIIVASRSAKQQLLELVDRLKPLSVTVRLCRASDIELENDGSVTMLAGVPMAGLDSRPMSDIERAIKRCLDLALTSFVLLALSPVMAAIAIAVRLDSPGPVLFRQIRYGFNANQIRVYKFRSMYAAACADKGAEQARRNDPRITRVGHFIRQTSLDELPQLFNVLQGEMSLVGPRPHPVALDERFSRVVDGYLARHRVLPGITGWAQVNGLRGETGTVEKMQMRITYDLHYIENWSVSLDLWILLRTVFVFLHDKNAY